MADARDTAATKLRELTECPICISAFIDPRVLPCIHTFCFECLKRTSEAAKKKPGNRLPCPVCQRKFTIPPEGIAGLQRNFIIHNVLEYKTALQTGNDSVGCYSCNTRNDGQGGSVSRATKRCLECRDDYCDSCSKVHQVSKNHHIAKIGSETEEERRRMTNVKFCTEHVHKPLDYYCAECKKIVCVSCFVESHKLHDCKDVTTVDEEFRQMIEKKAWKISAYVNEMLSVRSNQGKRKADFLEEIVEKEKEIRRRNKKLKDMIDRHTNWVLEELRVMKSDCLQEMENQMDEIEKSCTILSSFEAHCTELRVKGSASDVCSSVDELLLTADELEKDHETFIGRPHQSVKVSFLEADLGDALQNTNCNFVGKVEVKTEATATLENFAVIVGLNVVTTITNDVVEINLHWPNKISKQELIPTTMVKEAVASVYGNTMYITGIGANNDEIWKYHMRWVKCTVGANNDETWKHNFVSSWIRCTSLVQGRRRHSAAFIDEVLYICGGFMDSSKLVLDSVEAFNAVTNKCAAVGKLVHGVKSSGNCVPFRGSLYIFGGKDKEKNNVSHVQLYNTRDNTCTLISKPMPRFYYLMQAVLWETSVILLGCHTCLIFNIETETWQEKKQFKTDVNHFGLVLESEDVFVIGGGINENDKDGRLTWNCRDDVRYVSLQNILDDKPAEWKFHGSLPVPCLVHACAQMRFPV